jgi:hypothetical protein
MRLRPIALRPSLSEGLPLSTGSSFRVFMLDRFR